MIKPGHIVLMMGNVGGDELALTDFIFSTILLNVFCIWNNLNSKVDENLKFKDLCVKLSDILYSYCKEKCLIYILPNIH